MFTACPAFLKSLNLLAVGCIQKRSTLTKLIRAPGLSPQIHNALLNLVGDFLSPPSQLSSLGYYRALDMGSKCDCTSSPIRLAAVELTDAVTEPHAVTDLKCEGVLCVCVCTYHTQRYINQKSKIYSLYLLDLMK